MKKLLFLMLILPLASGQFLVCVDYADGRPGECTPYSSVDEIPTYATTPGDLQNPTDLLIPPLDLQFPAESQIRADPPKVPAFDITPIDSSNLNFYNYLDMVLNSPSYDDLNLSFNNSSYENLNLSSNNFLYLPLKLLQ
jgi:hypothetical protein